MGKTTTFILVVSAFFLGALLAMQLDEDKENKILNEEEVIKIKNKVTKVVNNLKKNLNENEKEKISKKVNKMKDDYKGIKNQSLNKKLKFLDKKIDEISDLEKELK